MSCRQLPLAPLLINNFMPLSLHLFLHFAIAILIALLFWRITGKRKDFFWFFIMAAILGGFLIDVDHAIEYLLVFGRFSMFGFLRGWEFLWSGKNILIFHAWEYVPIFLIFAFLLRRYKKISLSLLVFTIAALAHLVSDCFINGFTPEFYSISYRAAHNFSAQEILPARNLQWDQEQYQKWLPEMQREASR